MRSFPILDFLQDCEDPPLTPESLAELEVALGFRFPPDYAEFLLRFNGGWFHRDVEFDIPNPTTYVKSSRIEFFLGEPAEKTSSSNLIDAAKTFDDRVPDDFLVIGYCCGSGLVLLNFAGGGPEIVGVWFFDGIAIYDEFGLHWLADTFTEFLAMLRHDTTYEIEKERLPLFVAVERGNLTAIERYLATGGETNVRNDEGETLLMAAVLHQWPQIVRLLLKHSADVKARDGMGRTALHYAAQSSIDSVKLLLSAGADAKAHDDEGKGVLAGWSYRADQILRAHGAED